ncbi:MAG: SDR family NAD(P)-dependent oxidoreductase [Erythrobacter sp.]|uniref:SDR family NAD(P)-dependent oxidoreductase n=1 Tax=Erythrobacter sp. TaxID=1042 RepID=UPI00329952A8
MARFAGKTVIVTGSGRHRGLGQGILQRFADEGANCVVSDIGSPKEHMGSDHIGSTAEMEEVAQELIERGGQAMTAPCDVRDPDACQAMINAVVNHFGHLDIMINNAGIGYIMKPLLETSADEWRAVIDVNLSGAFHCTKAAAHHMADRGEGGRIINIASQAAKSGFPHMVPYCSSKHGMIGLTRSAAVELAQEKITVNAVCPNHVTTGLGEKQNAYFANYKGFADVEAYLEDMRARNPSGRTGLPSDIAAACAWLASDDAAYVTGEAMNVSGGEEMH